MTRRSLFAIGATVALVLGLLPILDAPAAAASVPAIGDIFVADTGNSVSITGFDVLALTSAGLLLILIGGALLFLRRRADLAASGTPTHVRKF